MATINGVRVPDGVGPLLPKRGRLSLADFHDNSEVYKSYLLMLKVAAKADAVVISEAPTTKQNDESP